MGMGMGIGVVVGVGGRMSAMKEALLESWVERQLLVLDYINGKHCFKIAAEGNMVDEHICACGVFSTHPRAVVVQSLNTGFCVAY